VDEREFWTLIDLIDREVLLEDEDEAVERLINELGQRDVEAIAAFQEHLARHLYALDGRRFAEEAGESDSAEDFLFARGFVVAQGEAHYRAVLADPRKMPKTLAEQCEPLLDVASVAYEGVTGKPGDFDTSVSMETGSNAAQWQ
jgi:hypothetical protein